VSPLIEVAGHGRLRISWKPKYSPCSLTKIDRELLCTAQIANLGVIRVGVLHQLAAVEVVREAMATTKYSMTISVSFDIVFSDPEIYSKPNS
jgi:hypothetical protein